ncbi:MAG TPA: hypothetical protein VGM87_19975 [Roseomonas sp.]|jgi:hypothetical protein
MSILSRRAALGGALLIGASGLRARAALAQGASSRVRGTVVSREGSLLTVATRDGSHATVTLTEPLTVVALRRVALGEIANGSNLGVVAEPGTNDELRAIAITVLPPGQRIREVQEPWDLGTNSSMNNGAVQAVMESRDDRLVTLSIFGHSVKVRITPQTALVMPIPAAAADLTAGAVVFINATRGADGQLSANRVTVGKDGVLPPI